MTKVLAFLFLAIVVVCSARQDCAQTTDFTYQGSLRSAGSPANGNYDLEFKLFDSLSEGTQQGSTIQRLNVPVGNGIFTVSLDFGAGTLSGADRYIEIGLRVNGNPGGFQQMLPRQKINSAPYAVRSLNAATADNVVAGGIPPGSGNYIQNGTSQQASSDFNVSGDGTVGGTLSGTVVNSGTQFNIGGSRILSNPGLDNTFAGIGTGSAGTTGSANSFFGQSAGFSNTNGSSNSFAGSFAGVANSTGFNNSFFGRSSGQSNTDGFSNSLFGRSAGFSNATGDQNSFFGTLAGSSNTTGNNNSFFGSNAGSGNTSGSNNTVIGNSANLGAANLANSTAIGANAFVSQNNSLVLGSINGVNGATADTNVGIGTTTPQERLHVSGNGLFQGNLTATQYSIGANRVLSVAGTNNIFAGVGAGSALTNGDSNAFFGAGAGEANTTGDSNSFFGYQAGNSTTASANTFVGRRAGFSNTNATENAFFGSSAGLINTGGGNTFIGATAGGNSTTGDYNVFVGYIAGLANTTGSNNTILGSQANVSVDNLTFATAVGAGSLVSTNNTIALGRSSGADAVVAYGKLFVGVTSSPDKLAVNGNVSLLLAGGGSTQVCQNAGNQLSTCSSSIRYKKNIGQFSQGMSVVNKLRPITFDWKDGGMHDVGFGAEDIAKIDPRFVTYNDKGEVEGVKYDRIGVVLVNAVKEQQVEISDQRQLIEVLNLKIKDQQLKIENQQSQIDDLKKIVCSLKPQADGCK